MRDKDWKTLEKNPECTTYLIIYRPEGVCNGSYELRNFSRQGEKKGDYQPRSKNSWAENCSAITDARAADTRTLRTDRPLEHKQERKTPTRRGTDTRKDTK